MPVRNNGYYNNPAFAQAASNLASLFEPPSGADAAGWATADAKRQEAQRLADFFTQSQDPNVDLDALSRTGLGVGAFDFRGSKYGVDQGEFTARRGQDVTAATSRSNNAADNARAIQQSQIGSLTDLYGPLNEGQVAPAVPDDIAAILGAPGAIGQREGREKPLSETELRALILSGMDPSLQEAAAFGNTPVETIATPEGPRIQTRLDAIGQQPVEKANVDVGSIPAGHRLTYDDQGRLSGMEPIPGSPAALDAQRAAAAAAAGERTRNTAANIVVEDIDRALAQIDQNPALTTGVGAAVSSRVPGTPAFQTSSLVDTVKANAGFDKLQQMRDASPTGGALGQVSEFENRLLQAAIGNLELAQNDEQVKYNLKRVSNIYRDIIDGPGSGPRYDLSQPGAPMTGAAGAPAAPAPAPAAGGAPPATGAVDYKTYFGAQ